MFSVESQGFGTLFFLSLTDCFSILTGVFRICWDGSRCSALTHLDFIFQEEASIDSQYSKIWTRMAREVNDRQLYKCADLETS